MGRYLVRGPVFIPIYMQTCCIILTVKFKTFAFSLESYRTSRGIERMDTCLLSDNIYINYSNLKTAPHILKI